MMYARKRKKDKYMLIPLICCVLNNTCRNAMFLMEDIENTLPENMVSKRKETEWRRKKTGKIMKDRS